MAIAQTTQNSNPKSRGSILIEVLIAVMITSVAFGVMLEVAGLSIKTSISIKKNTEAIFLSREAMEVVKNFRDGTTWATNGLGTVNTGSNNPYYFALNTNVNPNIWVLTAGTETTGIFTRKIIFDKVSRDPATQNIESTYNAANDDPKTRKVTVTVSWPEKTLNTITYFTNWK